mmetsp:Transcript_64755/g.135860  ORF Transcript_64755/g.135860 Transcript_64755/m.135860 type:complete len:96 (-) Transcript_64755:151-438(-)
MRINATTRHSRRGRRLSEASRFSLDIRNAFYLGVGEDGFPATFFYGFALRVEWPSSSPARGRDVNCSHFSIHLVFYRPEANTFGEKDSASRPIRQ